MKENQLNITENLDTLALKKLLLLGPKLKELGLTPCDRNFNLQRLQKEPAEFPIVEEGAQGIRVSYEDGELNLWFTNRFEDEANETRKKVEEIWENLNK